MLDAWGESFVTMHREACEATKVRHEQSAEALDLRMGCLRTRREQLRSTIRLLEEADLDVAQEAVALVASLPPVSGCADAAAASTRRSG
jgi:eukaryotic-like serine/threonine-protein kinase